ncbi:PAS domain S-box protein [Halovenus rubra]|uniref:histidine kinase n=2 Tax=Halovenus rubra TaxID=869890 RepID=A0ABD5X4R2_9EURY|nr:PAS domain S-box protein [Halovenus rubra]
MTDTSGGLELLVVTRDQVFGSEVTEAIEEAGRTVTTRQTDTVSTWTADEIASLDGVVVDATIAEPVTVVEQLTNRWNLPVVILSDSTVGDETVHHTIEAGAIDVFPRATAVTQYELVYERLASKADRSPAGRMLDEQPARAVFQNVSDGLVIHDPETGKILEVNKRYCELTGYDREELLNDTIQQIIPDNPAYTYDDAMTRIKQARKEGTQLFEFKGRRQNGDTFVGEVHLRTIEIRGREHVLASVRDISERKRRKREYEQIFNSVEDAIVVWDPETLNPLDANEAYLELFGYESQSELREEGVAGLSVTEEGYTEQRGREIHQRVVESGQPEIVEWKGETSSGDHLWLEVKVTPASIGGEQRTVSIQRDITERKRREKAIQALQDATERLQSAQTPNAVATIAVEAASDALDLPLALCWFHDADSDRLKPAAATEPVHEAGLVSPISAGRYEYEVFREGTVVEYTPSKHGVDNPLETGVLLPLADHGLVVAGTHCENKADRVVLDIAKALTDHVTTALDRVEREKAVRDSERRFRLIAERMDEVISLAEPDFSEILYVNPAYEEIWGQPVEMLYSDSRVFLDAVDDRDRARFEADFDEMLREIQEGDHDESYDFEFRLRQPNGEMRWVNATGYSVEFPGDTRRFVGIVDDITERKRREQRLQVFNRILRHNLRNQIDVIRTHAEILDEQSTDDHAERIIDAVDGLATMGARARKTDRIMSTEETVGETDLVGVIDTLVQSKATELNGITVTTELPGSARLTTNENAVTLAAESALENAFAYAASSVTVALQECTDGYVLTIDDDGPGIPEEELIPIEVGTETNLRHGRGLGLWQLRWSVDKLNGELSFDVMEGTTVHITIPDKRTRNETP